MTKINELTRADAITEGDLFPIWSSANGGTLSVTAGDIAEFVGQEPPADSLQTNFPTRAAFIAALPSLSVLEEGQVVIAAGLEYIRALASTAIADAPEWAPNGPVQAGHFGSGDAAINAAAAYADEVAVLSPLTYTAGSAALSGRFSGPEEATTSDGKRGRYFSAVKARPNPLGNSSSVLTAFNGDMSKVPFPVEYRITGAATLGQPATGYVYTPEATPHFTYLFNSSGHNEITTGNDGRTAATAYRTQIFHSGQGDAMAYNFSVFVTGAKAGATGQTGWLANPAGVGLAGEIQAGADGIYLNPMEINLKGETYDVAGVGLVLNMYRNDGTGALGAGWDGIRFQSNGTAQVDSAMRVIGAHKIGLNTTEMTVSDAAIVMAAGNRIYFDGSLTGGGNVFNTTLNNTYMGVPTLNGGLNIVVNGNAVLQTAAAQANTTFIQSLAAVTPGADAANSFKVYGATTGAVPYASIGTIGAVSYFGAATDGADSTTLSLRTANAGTEADALVINSLGVVNIAVPGASLQVAGTRVINARKAGWSVATGTATRTAFDTSTVTVAQLAERVKALIDDLHATAGHGLIGA